MATPSDTVAKIAERLASRLRSYESCVVAFSGGVDSAVVAKAASIALGDRAVAVTGVGPAVSQRELETARLVAREIGIAHAEIATSEIDRPGYVANAGDRCLHCKTELYDHAVAYAREHSIATVANGANTDDLGDYRPGLQAAKDFDVRSPLVDCGIDKATVRELAAYWQLSVTDKPAAPCLASRFAIGVEVTTERLTRVEVGEALLYELGFDDCRVRYHADDVARIEVPLDQLSMLTSDGIRDQVSQRLRELGFRHVTVDLEGLRSGSLNPLEGERFLFGEALGRIDE